MDKSDADSNYSDLSEDQASNISSISCLSDYKNEFLELKHLIQPNTYSKLPTNQNESRYRYYESTIKVLQDELEQSRKFNEKFQRTNEIKYNDKIAALIKQNKQLETNLENANKQIQRLFDGFQRQTTNNLDAKLIILEKENHEINLKNRLLNDQIAHNQQQIHVLQFKNDDLKRKLNESSLELITRISCIAQLKNKISQQYLDLQNLQKDNLNLNNLIDRLSNDLEYLKKSEIWYKQQLHESQDDKRQLSNEIHELKQTNVASIEKIDNLHLELTKWQCKCDEIQLKSLKEKEEILHKFETVTNTNDSGFINDHYDINYDETIIRELNDEIERIKQQIVQNNLNFDRVTKENSELLSKCLVLQKYQQQKENEIEKYINDQKALKMQLTISADKEESLQKEIDEMRELVTNLKVDLLKKNQENSLVDDSIKMVKEQFRILKKNHHDLKDELDKQIKTNLQLHNDKQALFMSNNWKICELDRCKNQENEIKSLQEKLLGLIQQNNELKHENLKLINDNSKLSQISDEKGNNLKSLQESLDVLKQQVQQERQHTYLTDLDNKSRNHSNLEIIECLNNICKLFEINCKIDSTTTDEFIKNLLTRLEKRCKSIVREKHQLKQIFNRIDAIQLRCEDLSKKTYENFQLLQTTNHQNSDEDVKRLRVLLEVKMRELKDKQKRYERNYSLLLRKVKEHMKYRNSAEKRNQFLQEMNHTITTERNDLKLLIESKNYEIQQLKTIVENYKQNKNLLEIVRRQLKQAEQALEQSKTKEETFRNELKAKDSTIDLLKQTNQTLLLENSTLSLEQTKNGETIKILNETIANLSVEITNLQNQLNKTTTNAQELTAKMDEETGNYRRLFDENQQLIQQLTDNKERNNYLSNEIKLLQSNLQQKSEEFNELQTIHQNVETTNIGELSKLQDVIFNLKTQLQTAISDIDLLKNQKFYLQRLCNDLKLALRFHVNHGKVVQEKLLEFCRNQSEIKLLDLPEIPKNSLKYNDEYIEKLLEKSQLLNKDNCLGDVKQSLNGLRQEIALLQKQLHCT